MSLLVVLAAITGLFFLLLLVKVLLKREFCVICLSVSITWLGLIVVRFTGYEIDEPILAILLGGSVVGFYYLIDSHATNNQKIFRLPFILSLFFVAYILAELAVPRLEVWIFLGLLWLVFGLIYIFHTQSGLQKFVKKLIECCKNW